MGVVGVLFENNNRVYYFDDNNLNLKKKLTVIVETEKGLQFGTVSSVLEQYDKANVLKKVIRVSTKNDYLQHLNNIKDTEKAIVSCNELIKKYNLKMRIVDATYTFDRSQLLFRFVADERIDFRQLAKELGSVFKTRIELRQIGIRDKAKEVGGLGPCGRIICCSKFLNEFDSVSINMAKNQSLALNPTKINGVCGRLLCCLNYEDDTYSEYKRNLPNIGDIIKTEHGSGKVVGLDVLKQTAMVNVDDHGIVTKEFKNGSEE